MLVTDFCAMEAYKGRAEVNLIKCLAVLERFPGQIHVLKGTKEVAALTNASALDLRLFIDAEQTAGFAQFCVDVKRADTGNQVLMAQLRAHAVVANDYLQRQQEEAAGVGPAILRIQADLPAATLRRLRASSFPTPDDADVFIPGMLAMARDFFRMQFGTSFTPSAETLSQTFTFRFSVASYLLALDWIRSGGVSNALVGRLANDVVDMNYVAYATYFDGVLSRDKKLLKIYREADWYVREVFGSGS